MRVLVFKTNIVTHQNVRKVKSIIDQRLKSRFSVDIEDEDCVMRIETDGEINENEIIILTQQSGFHCEMLTD